jgi:hypothetical protein
MNCKFLTNGLALSYDQIVKPCCQFKHKSWNHTIHNTDLSKWHSGPEMVQLKKELSTGTFPEQCIRCEQHESSGKGDSMRLNGESSYAYYTDADITLEIRPGNTCNFACQTCWPDASSRVGSYYKQAFGTTEIVSKRYTDYSFLDNISHRLRDIILLGGEPFYDKNCIAFLNWLQKKNLNANLTMFTNGSVIDWDFINNYKGKLFIVVSMDAYGKVAEYIRPGTEWETVKANYERLRSIQHIDTRVNITASVYNYPFISELLEWLSQDWPALVTFGYANDPWLRPNTVPKELVPPIVERLHKTIGVIQKSDIVLHQKQNTQGALSDISNSLMNDEFDHEAHKNLVNFMSKMDMVKNLYGEDFDPYFKNLQDKC